MNFIKRHLSKIVVLVVVVFVSIPTVFAAFSIDFDEYPQGTLAEDLNIPGVSFDGGGASMVSVIGITGYRDRTSFLNTSCRSPLTVKFDSPQTSVTFNYIYAFGLESLDVTASLEGNHTYSGSFVGVIPPGYELPEGVVSVNAEFDTLLIGVPLREGAGICFAIDNLVTTSEAAPEASPLGADGRINDDPGAAYVVYADGRGGIVIYAPQGGLLLTASGDAIAAATAQADGNTLIASEGNLTVHRLSNGEIQVTGPSLDGTKQYVVRFSEVVPNAPHQAYEE